MKFFKPEDFLCFYISANEAAKVCEIANTKLEREGKVVYGKQDTENLQWYCRSYAYHENEAPSGSYRAILINIEEIKKCEHPVAKLVPIVTKQGLYFKIPFYQCECGAKVKPSAFEVTT